MIFLTNNSDSGIRIHPKYERMRQDIYGFTEWVILARRKKKDDWEELTGIFREHYDRRFNRGIRKVKSCTFDDVILHLEEFLRPSITRTLLLSVGERTCRKQGTEKWRIVYC